MVEVCKVADNSFESKSMQLSSNLLRYLMHTMSLDIILAVVLQITTE